MKVEEEEEYSKEEEEYEEHEDGEEMERTRRTGEWRQGWDGADAMGVAAEEWDKENAAWRSGGKGRAGG